MGAQPLRPSRSPSTRPVSGLTSRRRGVHAEAFPLKRVRSSRGSRRLSWHRDRERYHIRQFDDRWSPFYYGFNGRQDSVTSLHNRRLSLGELKTQQFAPHPVSETVLFVPLGFNGTGTQADWSGNGNNCKVTGATQSADVPIATFSAFLRYSPT